VTSLQDCLTLDAQDPLRALRAHFTLPEGVIYLDGNSLGASPSAAAARVAEVVQQEWAQGLIRSWNDAGWISLPQRLGDQFAPWIGVGAGELVFTDTTSINLYKVLTAAARIAREDAPQRKRLISERSNFPTDLYIAQSVSRNTGWSWCCSNPRRLPAR
jgi:kynureninase